MTSRSIDCFEINNSYDQQDNVKAEFHKQIAMLKLEHFNNIEMM